MAISCFTPVLASENTPTTIDDNSVVLITPDAFGAVFSTQGGVSTASLGGEIDEVTYSYTFEEREDEPNLVDAAVNFTVKIGDQSYPISASGTVDAYALNSGETLWEGLLRGNTTINGGNFKILVGFAKLSSSDDIQVSVTIQQAEGEALINPLSFAFGESVVTTEIYQEITESAETITTDDFSEIGDEFIDVQSISGTYVLKGQDPGYMIHNGVDSYGNVVRAYYNQTNKEVAVTITSFCYRLEDYYSQLGVAQTTIDSFTSKLTRGSYSPNENFSFIDGVNYFEFDVGSGASQAITLINILEEVMDALGFSEYLISSVLSSRNDDLVGSTSYNITRNVGYVTIEFGLSSYANFDDAEGIGVPIVFALNRDIDQTYTSSSPYTYRTSITYRTAVVYSGSSNQILIYTDAEDAYYTSYFYVGVN